MSSNKSDFFHAQLASIIEVLANTAVAEICKLVDDGYAVLRLEINQNQLEINQNHREIENLRRKLLLAKFHASRRTHGALRRVHAARGLRDSPAKHSSGYCGATCKTSRGSGLPVIAKVEADESNRLEDIQPQGNQDCETTTALSANSSTPESRSLRAEPDNQKLNHHERNRNAGQKFQSHLLPFSSQPSQAAKSYNQQSYEHVNWESYSPVSNSDSVFNISTGLHNNNNVLTKSSAWAEASTDTETWNNSGEPPHSPSPDRRGGTGTKLDGSGVHPGASEGGGGSTSGDLGSVVPALVGNLDWEPDVLVVGSVPIKMEVDVTSAWSDMEGDTRTGETPAERRQQTERREGVGEGRERGVEERGGGELKERGAGSESREKGIDAANAEVAQNAPVLKSTLVNIKTLSHFSGLSSSSSSSFSTTFRTSRGVLPPQSSQGDRQSSTSFTLSSPPASSSRGALDKLPNYLLPAALLSQHLGSCGGTQFRCEVCGKAFAKFPSLQRHQRVHTGEKPFGCRHCSKRFSHRHQMKNHERVHTGEKPFPCPVCGRRFVQSNHLKRHLHIHAAADRTLS
ncbi:uncharacterized protein ACJ7VT_018951 [Polymixia lowei]